MISFSKFIDKLLGTELPEEPKQARIPKHHMMNISTEALRDRRQCLLTQERTPEVDAELADIRVELRERAEKKANDGIHIHAKSKRPYLTMQEIVLMTATQLNNAHLERVGNEFNSMEELAEFKMLEGEIKRRYGANEKPSGVIGAIPKPLGENEYFHNHAVPAERITGKNAWSYTTDSLRNKQTKLATFIDYSSGGASEEDVQELEAIGKELVLRVTPKNPATPESNVTALTMSCEARNIVIPDQAMVNALEELLVMAKCGRLRWFWGVGLTRDHLAATIRAGQAPDAYAAAGRLGFLADEYKFSIPAEGE